MSSDSQAFAGTLLLQEYLRLCTEIRSIEASNEKIIGLAFALVSAASAIGIAQETPFIFFVLPIATIGVLSFAVVSYICIFAMAGYKRHIEEELNALAEKNILLWERLVPERESANIVSRLLWVIYLLVATSIFILSVLQLSHAYGTAVGIAMAAILFFLMILFLVGVHQMLKTAERTYRRAKQLSESDTI